MTNCVSPSDYFIETSRRRHFMYIFTKIFFEECLQVKLMPLTQRSKPNHLHFLQELRINKVDENLMK